MSTDLKIPGDVMEEITYFRYCVQSEKFGTVTARQEVKVDYEHGLDAASAYYYTVASSGDPCPTRDPTLLAKLFNVAATIGALVNSWAHDLYYETCTRKDFEIWCRREGIPPWLQTTIYRAKHDLSSE